MNTEAALNTVADSLANLKVDALGDTRDEPKAVTFFDVLDDKLAVLNVETLADKHAQVGTKALNDTLAYRTSRGRDGNT